MKKSKVSATVWQKQDRRLVWHSFNIEVLEFEAWSILYMRNAYKEQLKRVLGHVLTSANAEQARALPDGTVTEEIFARAYHRIYQHTGVHFARSTREKLISETQKFDEFNFSEHFTNYVRHVAGSKIRGIAEGTRKLIRGLLGSSEGDSPEEIARDLVSRFTGFSRFKARQIARTETITAANHGAMTGARSLGLEMLKIWIASIDEKTRDSHEEADGQTVPIETPFIVGGESADHPGDPMLSAKERINCRCTQGFQVL